MTTEGAHSLQQTRDTIASKDGLKMSAGPVTVAAILKEQSLCNRSQGSYGLESCSKPAFSKSPQVSYHNHAEHNGKHHDNLSNRHNAAYQHVPDNIGPDIYDSEGEHYDSGLPGALPPRRQLALSSRSRSR